tara:strand:+ start:1048 stop:2619 length:1572 start_codon:yes stop_codon:yes gene_type:complete
MSKKIGVGIITCNRPDFFKKCRESIDHKWYDYIVVVNDGEDLLEDTKAPVIKTTGGEGVGRAKNRAMKHLLDKGCDYIILVEDDMLFKGNLFKEYIKAYKTTGIEHFMFAYHGPANKGMVSGGDPVPRKVIDYGDIKISLNMHCVGAVCFYTRKCLEDIGLYDEKYTNAFEHVDHSYHLAKLGYTTPYWWWPDLANSLDYVEEQACSEESSAIRPRKDWQSNIEESWEYFANKNGTGPTTVDMVEVPDVLNFLKLKKPKEKISFIVHFRKDTDERMKNFDLVYPYYKKIYPNSEFVFVEDDSEERIKHLVNEEDKYIFYKNDGVYNKCISYNLGFKHATNNIVCFLDIDCIVSLDSIVKSLKLINKHNYLCMGYNGTAIYLEHSLKNQIKGVDGLYDFIDSFIDKTNLTTGYRNNLYAVGNTKAVGGCLLGSKETFEKINCFNPNFIGWGYEDNEIISRAGALGVQVAGMSGNNPLLFHLPHEKEMVGIIDKDNHEYYEHNTKEVQKVEDMTKEELTEYIKSW